MQKVAENVWLLRFPFSLLGMSMGRTVTVIRLRSGEVVMHSTAPFTTGDVAAITDLGQPAWLVEATLFHDSFAKAGHVAFPAIPYLVPEGFPGLVEGKGFAAPASNSLRTPPSAWAGELDVLPLAGIPKLNEHVFFHRPSRTLIVADLVFNFGPQATPLTRWFFRWVSGIHQFPGMSRLFRGSIRDRVAFGESVHEMMQWDFDRLIVGHGEIVESDAKPKLAATLALHGY